MRIVQTASAVVLGAALGLWPGTSRADEPVGSFAGAALLAKYRCQVCHQPYDAGSGGPSLHAIAEKYASDPHARDDLAASVLNGSVGAWGPQPMAGYTVPESDLRPLIDWILSLQH
jgi:cytochrome c